jgi:hypothetical protein
MAGRLKKEVETMNSLKQFTGMSVEDFSRACGK